MNYCDDCILADVCGVENNFDDATTFCDYKHRFIHKSVLEDIKAELNELKSHYMPSSGVEWGIKMCLKIIDKHMESEDNK